MRYIRRKDTGVMHFLKPQECFEDGGVYTDVDYKTSVRRYFIQYRFIKGANEVRKKRMYFIPLDKLWVAGNPRGIFHSILNGENRSNFISRYYDDKHIFSRRKFWFFRTPLNERFDPNIVWDLGSKRHKQKTRWRTA